VTLSKRVISRTEGCFQLLAERKWWVWRRFLWIRRFN